MRRPLLLPAVVTAVLIAVGAWAAVHFTAGSPKKSASVPVAMTATNLSRFATLQSTPLYWVGPAHGVTYEMTRTTNGEVYLRYLPRGVPVGTKQRYLTVGTYLLPDAFTRTKIQATAKGASTVRVRGGVGFYRDSDPSSVFVAFPGRDVQIELYDPASGQAAQLVSSGRLRAVATKPVPVAATIVGLAGLHAFAASSGHPVYWAGPARGKRYEVTRTTSGNTFVRYLPAGVRAGAAGNYETIATYPMPHAFVSTSVAARTAKNVRVSAAEKAVAFYAVSKPSNILVAYRRGTVQIEVFDPSPPRARALVRSGALVPVG